MGDPRIRTVSKQTRETRIALTLSLDGNGTATVNSGIGFLDHMISTLARFSRIDIELDVVGDLYVDDHHTAEDTALAIGSAIDDALGERRGIARFGSAYAPLDEALARAVVDLSGRPSPHIDLGLRRENIGQLATENITHFFQSLAIAMRSSVHVDVVKGDNDHHRSEAAFKAMGLALRQAIALDGSTSIPSEKGVL